MDTVTTDEIFLAGPSHRGKWELFAETRYKMNQCVVAENIRTSPTSVSPLWKFQLGFTHPPKISIIFFCGGRGGGGGVWMFSGAAQSNYPK